VIAGVVAVVVLGLLLGYLALGGHKPSASPSGGTSPGQTSGSSASPNNSAVAVLADASMINERSAKRIDPTRTWLITSTQHGLDANSPQPACFTGTTAEGQPNATQTIQRLLNASGKNAPALLHQADAYATPEDAAQAYAVASRTLGTCAVAGSFLESGRAVTGLGDSATAAIVAVQAGGKASYHSVALNRTGRVVNIVDVAQQVTAADINQTANALGDATGVQCTSSGGACAGRVAVKPGPPPLGGDQPGFLAVGDLPPVGVSPSVWGGDPPHAPDPDFVGTGCETTNWAKVAATNRTARTYLPQDSNATFGLDEIILTTASPRSAGDLVNQVKKDLDSCAQRKLTATVSKPAAVTGPGAENSGVGGWSATVAQKTASTTTKFRVGIVSTGNKVIYTFLNPVNGLDFTDTQWQSVVLRSGQRASQVP